MISSAAARTARHRDAHAAGLVCAGLTDTGRKRARNEDRFRMEPELGLFLVADGMGGHAAGEVAAQMAVDLICEAFQESEVTAPMTLDFLVRAIGAANDAIHQRAVGTAAYRGMGTTIAAVLIEGQRAVLAHVGDSRIYRLRAGSCALEMLTEDHTVFNALVRLGYADPDRPELFENHHLIARALGAEPTVEVDARLVEALAGDRFLLCSDGLSNVLRHAELLGVLLDHPDLDEAADRFITSANAGGGPDNITAVLVRI